MILSTSGFWLCFSTLREICTLRPFTEGENAADEHPQPAASTRTGAPLRIAVCTAATLLSGEKGEKVEGLLTRGGLEMS